MLDKIRNVFKECFEETGQSLSLFLILLAPYFTTRNMEVEARVPEVYDFMDDEGLSNIDVNVEAIEQVTLETETSPVLLEMDTEEVVIAAKLLGEDFMPPDNQDSGTKSHLFNVATSAEQGESPYSGSSL